MLLKHPSRASCRNRCHFSAPPKRYHMKVPIHLVVLHSAKGVDPSPQEQEDGSGGGDGPDGSLWGELAKKFGGHPFGDAAGHVASAASAAAGAAGLAAATAKSAASAAASGMRRGVAKGLRALNNRLRGKLRMRTKVPA